MSREKIDGEYRFFPSLPAVEIRLSGRRLEQIDNLVTIRKFKDRSEAVSWLLQEGINAKAEYLAKVGDVAGRIELLVEKLAGLVE